MDRRTWAASARWRRARAALFALAAVPMLVVFATACGGDDSGDGDTNAAAGPGQPVQVNSGSFVRVTPAELQTMLQDKDFPLINVHVPYEGEIEGTDQHIPYDQIMQRLGDLPSDKNAQIVLYCRSGNMSTQAAGELVHAGYTNVWELGGGMIAWRDAGLPLITEA